MSNPARSTLEPPDYDGHFAMIPLTKGKFAIVDEADTEMVLNWMAPKSGAWLSEQRDRSTCYAARWAYSPTKFKISMHQLITGWPMTDHVNRNGLDNRRINLRPATWQQNMANRAPGRNNTSGYKGVHWKRSERKWVASIGVNGRQKHLGLFADPAEAARAYNRAAVEAFGEFAWLNPV